MAAKQHTAPNPSRAKRRPSARATRWQGTTLAELPSNEEWTAQALSDLFLLRLARIAMQDDHEAALARMAAPGVDVDHARHVLRFIDSLTERAKVMRARAEVMECVVARMMLTLDRVERDRLGPAPIFEEAARLELERPAA